MGANVNHHYQEVKESYLFAEIAKRIRTWQENNPEIKDKLIRMGIGGNLHFRRCKVRFRKYPGSFCPRFCGIGSGPCVSGVCGYQYHGRK